MEEYDPVEVWINNVCEKKGASFSFSVYQSYFYGNKILCAQSPWEVVNIIEITVKIGADLGLRVTFLGAKIRFYLY